MNKMIALPLLVSICGVSNASSISADVSLDRLSQLERRVGQLEKRNEEVEANYISLVQSLMRCETIVKLKAIDWNGEAWLGYGRTGWQNGINTVQDINNMNLGVRFKVECL